jgi:hypothetical protein
MFSKMFGKLIGAAAVIGFAALVAPTAMASHTPGDASGPSNEWVQIGVGQDQWYSFQDAGAAANRTASNVNIEMLAAPYGGASFSVWTPSEIRELGVAGVNVVVNPVGRGTSSQARDGDTAVEKTNWSGISENAATYYVRVRQDGATPGYYKLDIAGNGVSFAAKPIVMNAPAAVRSIATATTATTAAAVDTTKLGTGPGDALTAFGAWTHLNIGQDQWYSFSSAGNDLDENVAKAHNITMQVVPFGGAEFSVWTAQELRDLGVATDATTVNPVGRGTASDDRNGDTRVGKSNWSGSFSNNGTYYVRVRQTGATPSDYSLQLN